MKSKSALRLCLSLFICSALLIGAQSFLPNILTLYPEWFGILLYFAAMFIPIVLLHVLMPRKENFRPKLKPSHISAEMLGFTLCMALGLSFIRFDIEYLVYRITGASEINLSFSLLTIPFGNSVSFFAIPAAILVPALIEEFYLRGYIQTFLSEYMSTRQVIGLITCISAMLHGSLPALPGGIIFAFGMSWLTFIFGSFWYAVIAHAASSALFLFLNWLLGKFMVYGILRFLPALCIIFALLFFYIALRLAERLTLRQAFRKLHYVQHSDYSFTKFASNAAALAFLFVFIAKAVIGII